MGNISKISLTSICYVTEILDLVKQSLINVLPPELRDTQVQQHNSTSSFGDKISILWCEITDKQVSKILDYLSQKLDIKDKEFLGRHFSNRIDLDQKTLFIRFDKFKLLEEQLVLTEGSDVVKLEIGYSTFTNSESEEDNVKKLFLKAGVILE